MTDADTPTPSTAVPIPGRLLAGLDPARIEVVWSYNPEVTTYRLTHSAGDTEYFKVATPTWQPSLADEEVRMRWAADHLPVPAVVDAGRDAEVQWLRTRALSGLPAIDPGFMADPVSTVDSLAHALWTFHSVPTGDCPFDFRLDVALGLARRRVAAGLVVPSRDFHEEFAHLTAQQALDQLERDRPGNEDLVVCHGDYCPPNILFEGAQLTGFVDLAELGVADRWWDLAVATWSVGWNYGEQYAAGFLQTYGAELDPARCTYYRLLYDVVS